MRRFLICCLGTICLLAAPAVSANPESGETVDEDGDSDKWTFLFNALEEYRMRYGTAPVLRDETGTMPPSPAESDHDLRFFLGSSLLDPTDRFFADVSLGLWMDLNQTPAPLSGSALTSQYDESTITAGDVSLWIDVYSLYGEYHGDGIVGLARLGRQQAEHGRPATFDGATLRVRLLKRYLEMFAFGGRTVHFFNTDDGWFEDWLASSGFVIRPHRMLKFELDYRFLNETAPSGEGITNHSYGIQGWLLTDHWFYLKGHLRGLGDRVSRLGGATMMVWDKANMGLDIAGDLQLVALREINEFDDPYYAILGESRPNFRAHVDLWKAFETSGGTYTAHAGWDARMLSTNTPALFNRDYGKVYAWLQATDIAIPGPFAGVMFEYHYTLASDAHGDDNILTLGGSLGWDRKPLRVEAGTYYSKIKYNYYQTVDERENVRTYFGEVGYRVFDWLRVMGRYEFERFDRDIHQATLSLSQAF